MSWNLEITSFQLASLATANQIVDILIRDIENNGAFIPFATNAIIDMNGNLPTPIIINNIFFTAIEVKIINKCNSLELIKQYFRPTVGICKNCDIEYKINNSYQINNILYIYLNLKGTSPFIITNITIPSWASYVFFGRIIYIYGTPTSIGTHYVNVYIKNCTSINSVEFAINVL
jgi:hypothetical protein